MEVLSDRPGATGVRAATMADFDAIDALFAEGDAFHQRALPHLFAPPARPARSPAWVTGVLASEAERLFLAEDGAGVVGLLHATAVVTTEGALQPARAYLRLESLVVAERVRGRGIGMALMEHAEEWGRVRGLTDVELTVHEFNADARRLYERRGYAALGRRMGRPLR